MMRKYFLALAVIMQATLQAGHASAAILAQSNFDSSNEGWYVLSHTLPLVYPFPYTFYPAVHQASGGNPGGYISQTDQDTGIWVFLAPLPFRMALSEAYGGTLSYSLSAQPNGAPFDYFYDITLSNTDNSNDRLRLNTSDTPATFPSWTDFGITLDESLPWNSTLSGVAATAADFARILATDPYLLIRGDYYVGSASFLDSVVLRSAERPVPEPATMLLIGAGLFGVALMRQRQK